MTQLNYFVYGVTDQPQPASSATIRQSEGSHDRVTLTINSARFVALTNTLNKPVTVHWGTPAAARDLLGYVDTPSPQAVRGQQGGESVMEILGASSILRSSQPRVWRSINPSLIAQNILDAQQMGLVMDAYPHNLDNFSQGADESDWRTLNRLAHRLGYSLVADGTTVLFIDPQRELARTMSGGFQTLQVPLSDNVLSGNIDSFSSDISYAPFNGDFKNYTMTGVDKLGNVFSFQTSFTPEFGDVLPSVSAQSQDRFDSLSKAMIEGDRVSRMARWTMRATVGCRGLADFRPGRYVYVSDPGTPNDGWWYVTDVTHEIIVTPATYRCTLQMCKEFKSSRRRFQAPEARRTYTYPPVVTADATWRSSRKVTIVA